MNANEVLRIVDSLHREKHIEKEIVFVAIESALVSAARKHFGEDADIELSGGSHGTINVNGRLNADVSGGSQLTYIGDPTLGDIEKTSGSTVSRK